MVNAHACHLLNIHHFPSQNYAMPDYESIHENNHFITKYRAVDAKHGESLGMCVPVGYISTTKTILPVLTGRIDTYPHGFLDFRIVQVKWQL